MPMLTRIDVHPIKALDPVTLDRVAITNVGGLAGDRAYAIVDEHGEFVNGKRTADVHPLRADVDLDTNRVVLEVRGTGDAATFHLDRDRTELEAWLSDYFGIEVTLQTRAGGAQTDSAVIAGQSKGPSIISRATLREVASWYDGIDPAELRLRLRPNLVVDGVPAFWEDKLVAGGGRRIRIGDVTLEGNHLIPRCAVPTRDPRTGDEYEGLRETFITKREATLPEWAERDAFDGNFYKVMVGTRIPEAERDGVLEVGDDIRLVDNAVDG